MGGSKGKKKEKKAKVPVAANQPRITSFFGGTDQNAKEEGVGLVASRRKKRARLRQQHSRSATNPLEEITLSSDSESGGKAYVPRLKQMKAEPAKLRLGYKSEVVEVDVEDRSGILSSDDEVVFIEPKKLNYSENNINFVDMSTILEGGSPDRSRKPKPSSCSTACTQSEEKGLDSFGFDDSGDDILLNLVDQVMESPTLCRSEKSSSVSTASSGCGSSEPSLRPSNLSTKLGLSPYVSPSLLQGSPSPSPNKRSPKAKVNHLSPIRHLRKASNKRLVFQSPAKSGPAFASVSNRSATNQNAFAQVSEQKPEKDDELCETFHIILKSVMSSDEAGLFTPADVSIYKNVLTLSKSALRLYIKIFGRSLIWYRQVKVTYNEISNNLKPVFKELHQSGFFSELNDEEPMPTLDNLLNFLDHEEIKTLAKEMKANCGTGATKRACKAELLRIARTQRTLLSTIDSTQVITNAVLQRIGGTFRVSDTSRNFFSRVFVIHALPQYWDQDSTGTSHLLTTQLTQQGKMLFPRYRITKSRNIFRNNEDLSRFCEALALQSQIEAMIECKNWTEVVGLLDQVLLKLKALTSIEHVLEHDLELPSFLRTYTAGSVLTRTAWLGIEAFQKLKRFQRANEEVEFLLHENPKIYWSNYRGKWHERRLVNAKHLQQSPKKLKEILIHGLSDPFVKDHHRLAFTTRLAKMNENDKKRRGKKKSKRKKFSIEDTSSSSEDGGTGDENEKIKLKNPNFQTFTLTSAINERTFEAEQLSLAGDGERIFGKSHFLGTGSSRSVSSVEERAISFYMDLGYRWGIHGEGSVPVSIFGLLFWDVIYNDEVPDAFRGPYQAFPLDINSDDFFRQRKDLFEDFLKKLRFSWSLADAFEVMEKTWVNHVNELSIVTWNVFHSLDQAQRLVKSMGLALIADISERLAVNFWQYRSGFPDLVVWDESECLFVEVKGPKDTLSPKQSIWLEYLISIGAKAEVCRIIAVSNKRIRLAESESESE